MFTGIVETLGKVVVRGKSRLVVVPERSFPGLKVGESVAVDGVCLTVDQVDGKKIAFRLLPETLRASTVDLLKVGSKVNLERSLKLGDRLGGHFLLGHVDGQGIVCGRSAKGSSLELTIEISKDILPFVVPKGPIGVDGVSLTLGPKISKNRIQIFLVDHTLVVTTLGKKRVGSRVNLEADLIAKYLHAVL